MQGPGYLVTWQYLQTLQQAPDACASSAKTFDREREMRERERENREMMEAHAEEMAKT